MSSGHKSQARRLVRRGCRDNRSPPVAALSAHLGTPTVCERCGAVYERKTWRARSRTAGTLLSEVRWTTCPACRQVIVGEYFGRVSIRGAQALRHEAEVLARVKNVAARARFTQPERRLVATDRTPESIEVLTTSQKLAHRIAHELRKAYGGNSRYRWDSEDGSLSAVWTWDGP
jgi:NMD protein affecting ribosome stability and mRNA decay